MSQLHLTMFTSHIFAFMSVSYIICKMATTGTGLNSKSTMPNKRTKLSPTSHLSGVVTLTDICFYLLPWHFRKIFTARKRSLQRLCFYTCLSVHRGEGVPGQIPSPGRYTPRAGTSPRQVHSPGRYIPRAGAPLRQVHPRTGTPRAGIQGYGQQECIPVGCVPAAH